MNTNATTPSIPLRKRFRNVAAWQWLALSPGTRLLAQGLGITLLVCVHLFPGIAKILAESIFRAGLLNSPFIQKAWIPYLQWAVPGICLLIVALLCLGFFWRRALQLGLYLCVGWLLICTMYILAILTLAEYEPCKCVGIADWMGWRTQLLVNICLLYVAWLLLRSLGAQRYLLQQVEDAPPPDPAEPYSNQLHS